MPRTISRRAKRIDNNQAEIVAALEGLPGVSVVVGHDDILVGYRKQTYWFEVKSACIFKKDGVTVKKNMIRVSQDKIRSTWQGHYSVVWRLDQILTQIEFNSVYS